MDCFYALIAQATLLLLLLTSVRSQQDGEALQIPWWEGIGDGRSCSNASGRVHDDGYQLLQDTTARVNALCCDQTVGQRCSDGTPDDCSGDCAEEFLRFWSDCRMSLPLSARLDLISTVTVCQAAIIGAVANSSTGKQGFSGFLGGTTNNPAGFVCSDNGAVGLGHPDSWFYTWTKRSSKGGVCTHTEQGGAEFVPMINGVGQLTPEKQRSRGFISSVNEWRTLGAKYLLGYNEPDDDGCGGCHHPHMASPAAAAADWVAVQALAEQHSLTLVSPAMSTNGIDDSGRSDWLDDFFAECERLAGCDPLRVKYLAFHDYTGDTERLLGRARGLYRCATFGPRRPELAARLRE
eukprot:SAG11_NODE_3086_length_2703_cov_3.373272_3_plen_350_part_00